MMNFLIRFPAVAVMSLYYILTAVSFMVTATLIKSLLMRMRLWRSPISKNPEFIKARSLRRLPMVKTAVQRKSEECFPLPFMELFIKIPNTKSRLKKRAARKRTAFYRIKLKNRFILIPLMMKVLLPLMKKAM